MILTWKIYGSILMTGKETFDAVTLF